MWPDAADPILHAIRARLAGGFRRPLVVGVCGAQGSGKSSVCDAVALRLRGEGRVVAILSIDDLYLGRAEREDLARSVHPLLRTRGVPGTHDARLGLAVIRSLTAVTETALPRFDKASDDRHPVIDWPSVATPDVILFEGWFVGARPQAAAALADSINGLEAREDGDGDWRRFANEALGGDYQTLFAAIDLLVLLAAPSFDVVRRWRGEQEAELRRTAPEAPASMDEAALDRFVQHFERLTRHVLAEMPARADLVLHLDEHRRIRADSARP